MSGFAFPVDELPAVLRGPRVERRRRSDVLELQPFEHTPRTLAHLGVDPHPRAQRPSAACARRGRQ